MKKTAIAALLSLLVFPGTGHIWMKKNNRGMAIMLVSILALVFLLKEIFTIVWQIVNDINKGLIPSDMHNLNDLVIQKMQHADNTTLNISMMVLLCFWAGSVVDAIRIGLQEPNS